MENEKDEMLENKKKEDESYHPLASEVLGEVKKQNDRFFKIIIALIILVLFIEGAHIWERNQWDYATYEVNSNDGGNANFIGNNGDITNGICESQDETQEGR